MNINKKTAKMLPAFIRDYAAECTGAFTDRLGEILDKDPAHITLDDFEVVSDEELQVCTQDLVDAVADRLYDRISEETGAGEDIIAARDEILGYIEDPKSLEASGAGAGKLRKYERIFGKYRDIDEIPILLIYEMCYYILTGREPKMRDQSAAVTGFHSAFLLIENGIRAGSDGMEHD